MPKRQIEPEVHEVLVNRKNGKISSSSNEINILRVKVYLSGDNTGIMQPLYSAGKKLYKKNNIQTKRKRKDGSYKQILRHHARELLVPLAVLYDLDRPQHLLASRIKFAKWISQQLKIRGSEPYYLALEHNFYDLVEIDTRRGYRWWLQQLKNCRVK